MNRIASTLLTAFSLLGTLTAQLNPWTPLGPGAGNPLNEGWSRVSGVQYYRLDREAFREMLVQRAADPEGKPFAVDFPLPNGLFRSFNLSESPVMEEELARKFPEIRTFCGTDGDGYLRLSISPYSFQAYLLTPEGDVVIEAPDRNQQGLYASFYSSSVGLSDPIHLRCGTHELEDLVLKSSGGDQIKIQSRGSGGEPADLRTYRLALACTGEWGSSLSLGGGTVATALDKMVASMSYINAVYEKEAAIHMNLVANNDKIIFLDPQTDPYGSPTSGGNTLGQNTDVITGTLGRAAYDIGHVFTIECTDVGGVAFLASVCNGNKGGGVTCWYRTDIAYVTQRIACHEMGHQFSASHTFSNCNGNESGTSYEPGSGTSIMSYSGLCGSGLNVESGSLPHPNYFHTNSVERIYNYTRTGDGSRCGQSTPTANRFPEAEILFPEGLRIPIRTPFLLRGKGTDDPGETLTYNWEQYDNGGYGPILGEPKLDEEGPLFKSVFPGNDPDRVVPVWNTILSKGNFERTEVLPTVSRKVTFRLNVRDNFPGSGAVTTVQKHFWSVASAGPFRVSYPNSGTTDTLYAGACNLVRWDVANTDGDSVACKKVNIYLMPNRTNPNVRLPLVMGTENDGSAFVDIPDTLVGMIRARILVEAADNIFFDLSDGDIRILSGAASRSGNLGVSPARFTFCIPDSRSIDIRACSFGNAQGKLQLLVGGGLPAGAIARFEEEFIDATGSTRLFLDFSQVQETGIFTFEVLGIAANGDTLRELVEMDLVNVDFSDLRTVYPANGLSGLPQSLEFRWTPAQHALSYRLEIATSPAFGASVIFSVDGIVSTSYTPNFFLPESSLFYWRVVPVNRCGPGSPTSPSPFQTVNKKCEQTDFIGNVLVRSANKTGYMAVPIRGSGVISDVNLNDLYANAVGVNSITLTLVSPQGTRVKVFDRNCGVTDLFDCAFDDEGLYTVVNGCPPSHKKIIKPLESLSRFNGENKEGDWTLEITTDRFLSGQAYFHGFKLDICSDIQVNNPFLIKNQGLTMDQGQTRSIGRDLLEVQDADNTAAELRYTLVAIPQRGDLLVDGIRADYGTRFTQKDIDDGKLSYRHTGSAMEIDGFHFVVEDGTGGWLGAEFFRIQIGPVGTRDEERDPGMMLFPNPARDQLQFSFSELPGADAVLRLTDLQGRVWMAVPVGLQRAGLVSLQSLPDGLYLVELRSGRRYQTTKLLVARD
jgi:hypothetical protein